MQNYELLSAQLNEASNIAEDPSCQGVKLSLKINKESLSLEPARELTNLLKENEREDIFGEKITEMGWTTLVKLYINVEDKKSVHQKPCRLSQTQRGKLDKEVKDMLAGNFIEKSVSP